MEKLQKVFQGIERACGGGEDKQIADELLIVIKNTMSDRSETQKKLNEHLLKCRVEVVRRVIT